MVPLIDAVTVEVKLVENCDIVDLHATNGADLCINQGNMSREHWASLTDEERKKEKKKEKIQFLLPFGSGCRRSFAKVFTCIPVESHVDSDGEG